MRPLTALVALTAATVIGACASPGVPPGGPPDKAPPQIVRIIPDTGATNVAPARVVFRFDEVVSERPQGAASLGGLFLISPRQGEPDVDWERKAITVRTRRGWRPNTVYTVTMLPGLTDLRGNVRPDGAVAVFTTGRELPATRLAGTVFDWVAERPVQRPFVEAVSATDTTTVYVAQGDSSGAFVFRHLPAGSYLVRGVADANNNRERDVREPWDSVRVALADTARIEVLAFVHDTVGPGIDAVEVRDSVTLRLRLDNALDPAQPITAARFTVTAADSTRVPITAAFTARTFDEQQRAADSVTRARADTAARDTLQRRTPQRPAPQRDSLRRTVPARRDTAQRAVPRRDTTRRAPAPAQPGPAVRTPATPDSVSRRGAPAGGAAGPRPSRPAPPTELVLRLGAPLRPSTTYRVRATDLRGLLGATRASERTITTPAADADSVTAPAARDTTPAGRRAATPADTARRPAPRPPSPARGDTTRRPPR